MMTELFLDTTVAKQAEVKIVEGDKILCKVVKASPLPAIEESLKQTGLKLGEIDRFTAKEGPGSFTGIRVGLSVINSLNFALGRKVEFKEPKYQ